MLYIQYTVSLLFAKIDFTEKTLEMNWYAAGVYAIRK